MSQSSAKKTDEEWKKILSPEVYHVLRKKGTERAFTGKYWDNHDPGIYRCAGCGTPLFDSKDKFDSGSGWPSFTKPIVDESVTTETDRSLWEERTEILCKNCGGHLGHVFPDGPAPTRMRFCVNSMSLQFEKKK
jgi:peptide-methionine (R)-S-oxide reductase